MEKSMEELKSAFNELVKCMIYDTFIIRIFNKYGWKVKKQFRRG